MAEATQQFSFRLPGQLIGRVEGCVKELRSMGLDVNRADVVRLLLNHALDTTHCKLNLLVGKRTKGRASRK
jgi:hypothetical protein